MPITSSLKCALCMDKKIKYGEEGIYISSSESGFCSDEDPDPMIFGLPNSDQILISSDPDPTCNSGYII